MSNYGPRAALYVDWTGSRKSDPPYALYFFRDRQYIRWDVDRETLFEGYPQDIAVGWPGLMEVFPGKPLAGAMCVPGWGNKIYFFFKGEEAAVSWDVGTHKIDSDTVPVARLMPSHLTAGGPFAPVHVDRGEQQMVYAFRGDAYTRFTVEPGKLPEQEDDGYPRKIGDGWTGGLTVMPSCAVSVRWTHRSASVFAHKLYFFLGDLYTRWDVDSHSNNYRLDIPSGWKGWPTFD
ncbi:MAG: hemopexin repeat-containing protein [Pseudomonadota bacterium]